MIIRRGQQGAILLVSIIMVSVIAGIGVSFGSTANIHKKIVSAQTKNLDAKIKAASLRNIINSKIRQNIFAIGETVNPCKGIPNCKFLNKADGASLTDLSRGKDKSWWAQDQNSNQSTYTVPTPAANDTPMGVLRYIIREVSTPKDDSKIYEIIVFAADANGKYQSVARQYQTIIDPAASVAPPPATPEVEFPDWPAYRYTDAQNEQIFNTVMPKGMEVDSSSNITNLKSPGGANLKVKGSIKLDVDWMVRNSGSGFDNNAGAAGVIDIKDNFVVLVVGAVRTWPAPLPTVNVNSVTLVQFGPSAAIRAYVASTSDTRLLGFTAGSAMEMDVIAKNGTSSAVKFKYNTTANPAYVQDSDAFVAVLRRVDAANYTAFTATQRGDPNIQTHPSVNSSGNLNGSSLFSIGAFSDYSENLGSTVGIKEVRYIDRKFTDQEVKDLMNSTMVRYNFPS